MQNSEIESRQRLDEPEAVPCVQRAVRFIHLSQFFKPDMKGAGKGFRIHKLTPKPYTGTARGEVCE